MNTPGHLIFLGLLLPRLGVGEDTLRSDRFVQMDRSAGQHIEDYVFTRNANSKELGRVALVATSRSGRVTAIGIAKTTGYRPGLLERLVVREPHCASIDERHFHCRIDGADSPISVTVCGPMLVLFSANDPVSSEHGQAYCKAGLLRAQEEAKKPETQ